MLPRASIGGAAAWLGVALVQNQKMRRIRKTANATLATNAASASENDPITNATVPIFLLGFGLSGIWI
jgi:hypothetical protein